MVLAVRVKGRAEFMLPAWQPEGGEKAWWAVRLKGD